MRFGMSVAFDGKSLLHSPLIGSDEHLDKNKNKKEDSVHMVAADNRQRSV
jgi:hypothetical protein